MLTKNDKAIRLCTVLPYDAPWVTKWRLLRNEFHNWIVAN